MTIVVNGCCQQKYSNFEIAELRRDVGTHGPSSLESLVQAGDETWNCRSADGRSSMAFRKACDSASTEYGF
jgi:hypothetical protein